MKTRELIFRGTICIVLCIISTSLIAYGAELDEAASSDAPIADETSVEKDLSKDRSQNETQASDIGSAAKETENTATSSDETSSLESKEEATDERPKDSVLIGDATKDVTEAEAEDNQDTEDKTPKIVEIGVSGSFNREAKGLDYFKDIRIDLIGDNLTDDHFLTEAGLHWSDKTTVELIHGNTLGAFDFSQYAVKKDKAKAKAYTTNVGDTGRLTYVGRTKSGIDLDLIWTVTGSDQEEWKRYSGFDTGGTLGLTFVSEATFLGASGNSIAVIYNNASNLGLNYKIVAHGTTLEMPVILSFISSDIDSAQGVETNLANILEIIPDNNNLTKKDGIIYDKTDGVVNVNGSKDLPHGGYLGASFLSSFYYNFYSPAPKRIGDSYDYPIAVRYDIFGSSLQARMQAKLKRHMSVSYTDTYGKELKSLDAYVGLSTESYRFSALTFPKYTLVDAKLDLEDVNYPKVIFIYAPIHTITVHHVDESGHTIAADQTVEVVDKDTFSFVPLTLAGYKNPEKVSIVALKDEVVTVRYIKVKTQTPTNNTATSTLPKKEYTYTYISKAKTLYLAPKPIVRASGKTSANTRTATSTDKPLINFGKLKPFMIPEPTRDAFSENLGISFENGLILKNYIDRVERQYTNTSDSDKALLSSLGYSSYHKNPLQTYVINFNKRTQIENDEDIDKILKYLHESENGKIDIPHIAVGLRSIREDGIKSNIIKMFATYPSFPFKTLNYNDIFLLQNSLYGDSVTLMGKKDYLSDIDAYILQYSPSLQGKTIGQRLKNYYSIPNLEKRRKELYKEALQAKLKSGGNLNYLERANWGLAFATLGGLALFVLGIKERIKKNKEGELPIADEIYRKKWLKTINHKRLNKNIKMVDASVKPTVKNSTSMRILKTKHISLKKPVISASVKRKLKIQTKPSGTKSAIKKIIKKRQPKSVSRILAKKPVSRASALRKPVVKRTLARKPIGRKPVTRKSLTKKPISRKPAARNYVKRSTKTRTTRRINPRIRRL